MSDDIYLARFEYAKLTEQAAIPVIIVTANQDDYPRRYVARLWDMSVPTSTQYMVLEDTLEDLRNSGRNEPPSGSTGRQHCGSLALRRNI